MREVWRRRSRAKGQSFGRYKFTLQRLGLQAEAIATFHGGGRECLVIVTRSRLSCTYIAYESLPAPYHNAAAGCRSLRPSS